MDALPIKDYSFQLLFYNYLSYDVLAKKREIFNLLRIFYAFSCLNKIFFVYLQCKYYAII